MEKNAVKCKSYADHAHAAAFHKVHAVFVVSIIFFSVLRSLVPLLTHNPSLAYPSNYASFFGGVLLSFVGIYRSTFGRFPRSYQHLIKLVQFNFFLFACWMIPNLMSPVSLDQLMLFMTCSIFPFSVFAIVNLKEGTFFKLISTIAFILSGYLIWETLQINLMPYNRGYDLAYARQLILRPDAADYFGSTGHIYRTGGLLGIRPHDCANVLAMIGTYFFALVFQRNHRKAITVSMTLLVLGSLFVSQSASNILACMVGMMFVSLFHFRDFFNVKKVALTLMISSTAIFVSSLLYQGFWAKVLDYSSRWSARLSADGDWEGMTRMGVNDVYSELFSFFFGHGGSLNISNTILVSEHALIKMVLEIGIIHFLILMCMLSVPIIQFWKSNSLARERSLAYVSPIAVGIISLWHYGSIFKTTNSFILYAFFAFAVQSINRPAHWPVKKRGGDRVII